MSSVRIPPFCTRSSARRLAAAACAFLVAALCGCRASASFYQLNAGGNGPRILCVVAHPDDEITFAGTLFKTSTFLDGTCDVVVITNGEGGYKYSTLAENIYGLELTNESVGRAQLPAIRRRESQRGCELLGVRRLYFLDERDHRYTQDPQEILGDDASVWDTDRVQETLRSIMISGRYDFVFVLVPTTTTHGHHQSASILTLRAALEIPIAARPAILASTTGSRDEPPPEFESREEFPETRVRSGARFVFDRRQSFGYLERLDYRIVVNWAIAEHRSQGTMQLLMNAGDQEHYFLFDASPPGAELAARALFEALGEPQFPSTPEAAANGERG